MHERRGQMRGRAIVENGTVRTMCRMCDTRCAVKIKIKNGVMVNIMPDDHHPVNEGRMCVRGLAAMDQFYHPDRILRPLKRQGDGRFVEISRDQALDEIAEKMIEISDRCGARAMSVWKGEALGFGQQEEYARRFIHAFGSVNYFSNDSACFNSRYLGFRLVNGFWNNTPAMHDARLIIIWATNPPACHLPFMRGIADALQNGAKLIVIDPRMNPVAYKAHIHARPVSGTDGALAWGLCRYLIKNDLYDHDFVEKYCFGFKRFAAYAEKFTPEFVERETGVDRQMLLDIGAMIGDSRPRVVAYPGAGLEHQENGVNNIRVLAGMAAMTGAVDIRGGWPWPEFLGRRNLTLYDELPLPGVTPIGADQYPVLYNVRHEFHTMTAMDYMLGKGEYPIKGMILTGANPAVTNPNTRKVIKALSSLDLLVVNDFFMTGTARLAHYILPAATFLERSELHEYTGYQRVGLSQKIFEIDDVKDDYLLWHDLAHRLRFGERYFPWPDEAAVTRWMLEPTGITLEALKAHPEGIMYKPMRYKKYEDTPFPTLSGTGKIELVSPYLKKFNLPEIPEYISPCHKALKDEFPLVLQTGARKGLLYHSRHQNIPHYRNVFTGARVEIHPATAAERGIMDGDRVRIMSEVGSVVVRAGIVHENEILPDVLELYHGWEDGPANLVTCDERCDPISGFPLLKAVPVRLEKA